SGLNIARYQCLPSHFLYRSENINPPPSRLHSVHLLYSLYFWIWLQLRSLPLSFAVNFRRYNPTHRLTVFSYTHSLNLIFSTYTRIFKEQSLMLTIQFCLNFYELVNITDEVLNIKGAIINGKIRFY